MFHRTRVRMHGVEHVPAISRPTVTSVPPTSFVGREPPPALPAATRFAGRGDVFPLLFCRNLVATRTVAGPLGGVGDTGLSTSARFISFRPSSVSIAGQQQHKSWHTSDCEPPQARVQTVIRAIGL